MPSPDTKTAKPRLNSAKSAAKSGVAPSNTFGRPQQGIREKLFITIFEADTRAGYWFDFALIIAILLSVTVVMLDSVAAISDQHGALLNGFEWFFTALFAVEYIARLCSVRRPLQYAKSFFGIVDLLSIIPTLLAFFIPGLHALIDFRLLRLLRMFRLFKLTSYAEEYVMLGQAIAASRRRIMIFLSVVAILVILNGTLLYVVEGGPGTAFSSIPTSVYWAISTVSTVGFGDIAPRTDLGRTIASFTMLIGWGILAVPTGIVTSEMTAQRIGRKPTSRTCPECFTTGLDAEANFCMHCGSGMPPYDTD